MDTTASAKQEAYKKKQHALSAAIKAKAEHSEPVTLLKKTSNLFRHRKARCNQIDVRQFNQVLTVDPEALTATVEGMTTFEDLVTATLKVGCMPRVVPELKTITVGGALSGVGIESSSFRYGLVHETITEFEVLLPDGRLVVCNPNNQHRELFFAFANSYGTLGYALKICLSLIPVKPYVKLTHHHFKRDDSFIDHMTQCCKKNHNSGNIAFIEGVIFSKDHFVVSTAEFVDHAPYTSNYKYMNIYYRTVEHKKEDYLTTHDYIWRWDTDWFWCSKVFMLQHPVIRFIFGKWALKSRVYAKIMRFCNRNKWIKWLCSKQTPPTESVIQDVCIPSNQAHAFLHFFLNTIPLRPLWICPIQPTKVPYTLFKLDSDKLYLNFGFWGMVPSMQKKGHFNRLIERKVKQLQGRKSLYSNVFYSEQEFWEIFNKSAYDALKAQYDPRNALGNLYDKCCEK